MNIAPFTKEHVPQTLALSTQIGWNHTEHDWLRNLDLNPQLCLAGFLDGKLIATSGLSQVGDLGWLCTFIVDQAHQRKGYGSQILEELLRRGQARGIAWFAVDSSDVGRPIYNRLGFVLDEPIERWTGPNAAPPATPTLPLTEKYWAALLALDHESAGLDRQSQLRHLAAEPGYAARVLLDGTRLLGFGFSRPGRVTGSIGPLVATSDDAAQKIFAALLADRHALDGHRGIALDALGHENFKAFLTASGFQMRRRNIRMFRPNKKRPVFTGPNVYLATALGMG